MGSAARRGLPHRPVPARWPARGAAASRAAEGGSACAGRARRASEPAAWRAGGGTEAHVRALVHLRDDGGEARGRRRPWQRQAERGCRRRSRAGPPSPRRAPCSLPPSPARGGRGLARRRPVAWVPVSRTAPSLLARGGRPRRGPVLPRAVAAAGAQLARATPSLLPSSGAGARREVHEEETAARWRRQQTTQLTPLVTEWHTRDEKLKLVA